MKFGKELPHLLIPEWKDKYIDYIKLKKILKKASKIVKKKYMIKYGKYIANNVNSSETEQLLKIQKEFFTLLLNEFDKFTDSFLYIYYGMIYPNFVKLIVNFDILKANAPNLKQQKYIKKNIKIKNSLERFYKLIVYAKEFINLNYRIIYKITKKFKKIFKKVDLFKTSQIIKFNEYVCTKYCAKEIKELEEIKNRTEKYYYKKYPPVLQICAALAAAAGTNRLRFCRLPIARVVNLQIQVFHQIPHY